MIRLQVPDITEGDIEAVAEVLRTGNLVQGPRVQEFERAVAEYVGVAEAVAVSSGTAALHLALLALGVGPGDLVVTTAYSFPATANVIALCGARAIFVDVQRETFNIEPEGVRRVLRDLSDSGELHHVKAILPVHSFGLLADMEALTSIAEDYSIPIVEDAACALGARASEKAAGAWGVMGCFSFHPRKVITTGEGGMITTDDAEFARTLRVLRNHGQDSMAGAPEFVRPGFNYRMTDSAAVLGTRQLGRLDRRRELRRGLAAEYRCGLASSGFMPQALGYGEAHALQSFVMVAPSGESAEMVIEGLRERGVEATIGTYSLPSIRYLEEGAVGDTSCPVARSLRYSAIALPLHPFLTTTEVRSVVELIGEVVGCGAS